MRTSFELAAGELEHLQQVIHNRIEEFRPEIQEAMANEYRSVVINNMGQQSWFYSPLSDAYAMKVKRPFATLFVTGELRGAVTVNPQEASVSISDAAVPYATVHQFGGGNNIPARPYFPLPGAASPVGYDAAVSAVREAASNEVRRLLK